MSSTAAKAAERPLDELARRLTKRSSIAKVTEGREVEPGSGEEASARRHRFADIRDTRNRLAAFRSLAPASISSAASSRTCSRRDRSAAVRPPPPGYLRTTPAYRDPPATA